MRSFYQLFLNLRYLSTLFKKNRFRGLSYCYVRSLEFTREDACYGDLFIGSIASVDALYVGLVLLGLLVRDV